MNRFGADLLASELVSTPYRYVPTLSPMSISAMVGRRGEGRGFNGLDGMLRVHQPAQRMWAVTRRFQEVN